MDLATHIFREYDIRGIVGTDLDPEVTRLNLVLLLAGRLRNHSKQHDPLADVENSRWFVGRIDDGRRSVVWRSLAIRNKKREGVDGVTGTARRVERECSSLIQRRGM